MDFAIVAVLFFVLSLFYGYVPPLHAVLALGIVAILYVLVIGAAILLSALSVKYRDLRLGLPTITALLLLPRRSTSKSSRFRQNTG